MHLNYSNNSKVSGREGGGEVVPKFGQLLQAGYHYIDHLYICSNSRVECIDMTVVKPEFIQMIISEWFLIGSIKYVEDVTI